MDKELTNSEQKLFELLESKRFEELSDIERIFVSENCGKEEYKIRRQIIEQAEMFEDSAREPRPLLLPVTSNNKGIMIPLYQVLIGVAALLIFFFSIWPREEIDIRHSSTEEQQKIDTIYQTKLIYDTITRYIPQIQMVEKIIRDTVLVFIPSTVDSEVPRLLDVNNTTALPDLTKDNLQNNGKSLKEDGMSFSLLPMASILGN